MGEPIVGSAMMDVAVEIHCGKCGSANYSVADGAADAAPIMCNDCGIRLGSVAELKEELIEQALAQSAERLRRELDPPGGGDTA